MVEMWSELREDDSLEEPWSLPVSTSTSAGTGYKNISRKAKDGSACLLAPSPHYQQIKNSWGKHQ